MTAPSTRDLLLDAAETILLTQSWEGLSIRKLGKAAGLSYAALYRHFTGVEELKNALVQRQYGQFLAYIGQFQGEDWETDSSHKKMLRNCMAYLRYWKEQPRRFDLFRQWVEETGQLAWKNAPAEGDSGVLNRDLASLTGLEPGDVRVQRGTWFLETVLFGLAQAQRAEQSCGREYDEFRYRVSLESLLTSLKSISYQ